MSLPIIATFPIQSKLVPTFLENIIDKKVAGIALNLLEQLVDWIVSWIYCPYNSLYAQKMNRIHLFSDSETQLLDSTMQSVARIDHDWKNDYISLHGNRVLFSPIPNIEIVFSRTAFTDHVVIQDDENRRPGWYKIIEKELPRPGNLLPMEKFWRVNTNQFHQILGGPPSPVYLAEQPDWRHK